MKKFIYVVLAGLVCLSLYSLMIAYSANDKLEKENRRLKSELNYKELTATESKPIYKECPICSKCKVCEKPEVQECNPEIEFITEVVEVEKECVDNFDKNQENEVATLVNNFNMLRDINHGIIKERDSLRYEVEQLKKVITLLQGDINRLNK